MAYFSKLRCNRLYVGSASGFATSKLSASGVVAGASGSAGTVDSYSATSSKGYLRLAAVANDGDTATTISNAAMGQASVVSIPDPGAATANFLLTSQGNDGSVVTATAAEINNVCDASARVVSATAATLTITAALHGNRIVMMNRATGIVFTLPEATGTGDVYTFITGTALSSGSYKVITVDTTNADIAGFARGADADDDTVSNFTALQADGFDYVAFALTTTGGAQPGLDKIILTDVATDLWNAEVHFECVAGSNPATPFATT